MRRSWSQRLAVLATVPAVILTFAVAPAQAGGTQTSDGFEGNPSSRWAIVTGGSAWAGFDINVGTARSGTNNAWIFVTNGWAYHGLWVTTSAPSWSQCVAQFYFNASGGTFVGIEVWDPYANALSLHYPFISGGSYQQVTTPWWNLNGRTTLFVKAIIGSDGPARFARIDDMTLHCWYP